MSERPSPARLEAFSDGVIAVIITIMVLEFKVPKGDGMAGLVTILPTLAVYLLSFAFTAIYWVNHHHMISRLKRVDPLILYANLVFLFCLSLLPFFTGYVLEKHVSAFSAEVYVCSLMATAGGYTLLSLAIARHLRRTERSVTPAERALFEAEMHKTYGSLGFNVLAALTAPWHPVIALVLSSGVVLMWVVPTFGLEHHKHVMGGALAPGQEHAGLLDGSDESSDEMRAG